MSKCVIHIPTPTTPIIIGPFPSFKAAKEFIAADPFEDEWKTDWKTVELTEPNHWRTK